MMLQRGFKRVLEMHEVAADGCVFKNKTVELVVVKHVLGLGKNLL